MGKNKFIGIFCALTLTLAFVSGIACAQNIKGNGKIKTEVRQISGFNKIVVQGHVELFLSQETTENVKIESEENLISLFQTTVTDGTLHVFVPDIKKASKLTVTVAFKELKQITLLKEVTLKSEKVANFDDILIVCGGTSKINFEYKAASSNLKIFDAATASLRGYSEAFTIDAHDDSEVNAFDLQSDNCTVIGSGYAEVSVNAKKKLDITISGNSNLYYMGEATISNRNFDSSGLITKRKTSAQ